MAWSGLGAWRDTTDGYAPEATRDTELAAALAFAMTEVERRYKVKQDKDPTLAALRPYPATTARDYAVSAVSDEFWNQCRDADDESTELRRLAHHRGNRRAVGEQLAIRTTADGFPVARYSYGSRNHEMVTIMWPRLMPDYPFIPEASRIVATDDGDAAVFIRRPDGSLTPLPRPARSDFSGWSWGYSGSGPLTLASAIAEVLTVSDGIDYRPHYRRIEELLGVSPQDRLDISIDRIRAVLPSPPTR
ncbi:hypothetical protein JOJ87_005101 [Rhodococcus ruber]|uniref:hypothetical protein n=1 Tax=Rhodococcus ruber TaxID=1830 RepID=UPI001AE4FD27|nr:hypothetical protein [Rhodococcus ruber]MBP2214689.1 hypothetical protein [Rhodococcus ruber]